MFRVRRWLPVSLVLALIAFLGLATMGSAAPTPPDPPDPPALAPPAPAAPPAIHIWSADDLGDLGDGPMAFMGDDELAGAGAELMAMASGYGGWTRGEMAKTLKLTDDQKSKIDALTDKQRRAGIQARADLEIAQLDMAKLLRADNPDRSAIEAQIDKISNQRAELRKAQVRTMLDVRTVLTPQQRDQLKAEREKMRADMHDRFRGGAGRHREMIRVRNTPLDTQ